MIRYLKKIVTGLIITLSVALYLLPFFRPLDKTVLHTASVVILSIGFWATGALPEYLTAILFFLLAIVLKLAPENLVFSGFHSKAIWLVFGGLVLGIAVKNTGLGQRLANRIFGFLSDSYLLNISIVVATAVFFSFFMPSTTGRVVILVPVVSAMCDRLSFQVGSNGRNGMVMAAILACYAPSCAILPSNVANMILAGAAEKVYGLNFSFGEYAKWHFPVLAIFKAIAIIFLAKVIFPARICLNEKISRAAPIAFSGSEKKLTVILSITLLLWATDTIHGISPAWVVMAAGMICLFPFLGILPTTAFGKEVNFNLLFFVAGVLGVGTLVAVNGLGQILGEKLLDLIHFYPSRDGYNFICLALLNTVVSLVTTVPGLPAVMTPLAQDIAVSAGFSLKAVIMTQVIGFSTPIFPYQIPPILVGMALGGVSASEAAKIMSVLAIITILLIVPAIYLWWSYIGIFH